MQQQQPSQAQVPRPSSTSPPADASLSSLCQHISERGDRGSGERSGAGSVDDEGGGEEEEEAETSLPGQRHHPPIHLTSTSTSAFDPSLLLPSSSSSQSSCLPPETQSTSSQDLYHHAPPSLLSEAFSEQSSNNPSQGEQSTACSSQRLPRTLDHSNAPAASQPSFSEASSWRQSQQPTSSIPLASSQATTANQYAVSVSPVECDAFMAAGDFIREMFDALNAQRRSLQDCPGFSVSGTPQVLPETQPPPTSASPSIDVHLSRLEPHTLDWLTPGPGTRADAVELPYGENDATHSKRLEATAERVISAIGSFTESHQRQSHQTPYKAQHVTLFCGMDPDAVCAVVLLKRTLADRFGLHLHIIPVSCHAHLRHVVSVEKSRKEAFFSLFQSGCLIFINCGSRQDVREVMKLSNATNALKWNPEIFIIDHHRPVAPQYFRSIPTGFTTDTQCRCRIVTTAEELHSVNAERKRMFAAQRRKRRHIRCRRTTGGDLNNGHNPDDGDDVQVTSEDEESDSNSNADDEDLIEEDNEETNYLETETSMEASAWVTGNPIGEYYGTPTSLVIFEAITSHNLETPGMYFTVATALGFHFQLATISRDDYNKQLLLLHEGFARLRRRLWKDYRAFSEIKPERRELLIPLLRFTTIENGIRNSALLLRAKAARFATADLAEKELSGIRVQLGLPEAAWSDQFRFLGNREQQRLLRHLIPKVFLKATLSARRRMGKRYPDDEDTCGLVYAPAFIRFLSVVGLPDRLSSLDTSFLLLGLLSRPYPRVASTATEPGVNASFASSSAWLAQGGGAGEGASGNRTPPLQQSVLKPPHAAYGYTKPLFGETFMEACALLDSADLAGPHGFTYAHPTWNDRTVWFFGNLWDAYTELNSDGGKSFVNHCNSSLASLAVIALRMQQELIHLAVRLLSKRRVPYQQSHTEFRRASENTEGYMEEALASHIQHPLLLRYISVLTSDCAARGIASASPNIVLVAGAPAGSDCGAMIVSHFPTASLRHPSKIGLYLQDRLEYLKLSGMLDAAFQDAFDAGTAYIPNNKLHIVFNALFPPLDQHPPNLSEDNQHTILHSHDDSSDSHGTDTEHAPSDVDSSSDSNDTSDEDDNDSTSTGSNKAPSSHLPNALLTQNNTSPPTPTRTMSLSLNTQNSNDPPVARCHPLSSQLRPLPVAEQEPPTTPAPIGRSPCPVVSTRGPPDPPSPSPTLVGEATAVRRHQRLRHSSKYLLSTPPTERGDHNNSLPKRRRLLHVSTGHPSPFSSSPLPTPCRSPSIKLRPPINTTVVPPPRNQSQVTPSPSKTLALSGPPPTPSSPTPLRKPMSTASLSTTLQQDENDNPFHKSSPSPAGLPHHRSNRNSESESENAYCSTAKCSRQAGILRR